MNSFMTMQRYSIQQYRVKKKLRLLLEVVKRFMRSKLKMVRGAMGFQHPRAEFIALHFHSISLEGANIVVHLVVNNPNWFSVHLVSSELVLENEGRKLFEAKVDMRPDTIGLKSSLNVDIPLKLIYRDVEMAYPDVQPGMLIPAICKADLTFKEPLIGLYSLRLEKAGLGIPIPTAPEVCIQRISFDRFSFARSDAKVQLRVLNTNPFSVSMLGLQFTIVLGEVELVRSTVGESIVIQRNDFHIFDAPISFHPREFGRAAWHTISGTRSSYELFGMLEAETSFGTLHLPFNTKGLETRLETVNPYEPDEATY